MERHWEDIEMVRKCPACDDDGGRCEICGTGIVHGEPTAVEALRAERDALQARCEALGKVMDAAEKAYDALEFYAQDSAYEWDPVGDTDGPVEGYAEPAAMADAGRIARDALAQLDATLRAVGGGE